MLLKNMHVSCPCFKTVLSLMLLFPHKVYTAYLDFISCVVKHVESKLLRAKDMFEGIYTQPQINIKDL